MSRNGARRSRVSGPGRYSRAMLLTGWTAIVMTVVLVCGTLYAYAIYRNVWDGITEVKLAGLGKRPPQYKNALNLLLIGSDSRSGRNGKIGGPADGQRSDTVMIVHVSPGRKKLSVISFPRDSVVPILACPAEPGFPGQTAQPGQVEQLNSTFSFGGANCLLHTLEQTTHVRLNDFVQLNFTGFISVINDLGGVKVCIPYRVRKTRYDRLKLTAGVHLLKGYKALQYWRLREGYGLGSDLQRIQRDQLLMVSLVQKILHEHVLKSVSKTYAMIKDIVSAHALTTDTGLDQTKILHIVRSLAYVNKKAIQFVEVPTVPYTGNANWVQWASNTQQLFSAIEHDQKLPKVTKTKKGGKGKHSKGKGGGAKPPKLLAASKVSVEVLNGSGVTGIAGTTAAALGTRGFHVLGEASATTSAGAPDYSYTASVVEYSSNADLAAARTVAAQVTGAQLKLVSTVKAGTVDLILGKDFKALADANSQPTGNLAGQFGGYTGGTNVCKGYGSAFQQAG